jgi:hypothetical protein
MGKNSFGIFFFDMSTQEGGGEIRTNNLRFMRCGLQPIELPLGNNPFGISIRFFVQILTARQVSTFEVDMWHYIYKKNFKKTIKNFFFFFKKEKNGRRVGEPPPGPVQGGQTMGGGLATAWQKKKKIKKIDGF